MGLRVASERLAVLNERIAVQTEVRDRLEAALRDKAGERIRPADRSARTLPWEQQG